MLYCTTHFNLGLLEHKTRRIRRGKGEKLRDEIIRLAMIQLALKLIRWILYLDNNGISLNVIFILMVRVAVWLEIATCELKHY